MNGESMRVCGESKNVCEESRRVCGLEMGTCKYIKIEVRGYGWGEDESM